MYFILNTLVFLLLSGYAFVLMLSKPSYVKLSKTEKTLLTGREKFLLLTIATGMIQAGSFSAFRLMLWICIILFAFLLYRKLPKLNVLVFAYMLFLGWMIFSLSWVESVEFGVRNILKYLYPFLIMLFAATFVRSKDFIFVAMRWMIITAVGVSLLQGGFTTHVLGIWFLNLEGVFWPMSTMADYLAIMSGVSYLMWWRTKDRMYLYLIGWFLLSSVLGSVRTGLLGIFAVLTVASYLRYRVYALPYIAGIAMFSILLVVFIPQVKEKMFYDSSVVTSIDSLNSIELSQINSSGRFAMWEWMLNTFYEDNKLTGSGIGSVQERFYSGSHPFGRLKVVHNDYVQILGDVGLVGISLYLLFVLFSVLMVRKYIKKSVPLYLQNTAFLAVTSFAAVLTTMMTDNVVNYSFAAHSYPFIFVGIMIAYRKIYKDDLKMQNKEIVYERS